MLRNTRDSRQRYPIDNVSVFDFPYGLSKEGCTNSFTSRFKVFQGVNLTNTVSDSFGIKLTSATLANSTVYVGFTHKFNQVFVADNRAAASIKYGILLEHTDVALFSDVYVGRCADASVYTRKRSGLSSGYVTAVMFQNSYFDGVSLEENRKGVKMYDAVGFKLATIRFDNCIFGQYETAIECTASDLTGLYINGTFIYNTKHAVYIQDASQVTIEADGNNLNSSGISPAAIILNGIDNIDLSCRFKAVNGPAVVRVAGQTGTVNIKDVQIDTAFSGVKLDWVATASKIVNLPPIGFTPFLKIGGGQTGVAYASRRGTFSVTNGIGFAIAYIALSSKGANAGNVSIDLPAGIAPTRIGSGSVVPVFMSNAASPINDGYVAGLSYNSPSVSLYKGNGAGTLPITAADISDTTTVYYAAHYPV